MTDKVDPFHVKSPSDGIVRGLDEHYDGMDDVSDDPYGAWLAIQNLWQERERLRTALQWIHGGAHTCGHTLPDIKETAGDALGLNAKESKHQPSDGPTNPPRPVDALIPTAFKAVAGEGDKQKWWRLGYTRKRK